MLRIKKYLLFTILVINAGSAYGQINDNYAAKLNKTKKSIEKELTIITHDSAQYETIFYFIFDADYQIAITNNTTFFRLFLFKYKGSDSFPLLLYFSIISKSEKDFSKLFDRNLYWKKTIFLDNKDERIYDSIINGTQSDFYYYGDDCNIVAEFHVPTFCNENPLQSNHQFLLDLRMNLILKYIFGKNG